MITSKTLLITILSFLIANESLVGATGKDCSALTVTYQTREDVKGHTLDITVKGGTAPYIIILSDESGKLLSEDFKLSHFESIKSGKYGCVVGDQQNCRKTIEITIP